MTVYAKLVLPEVTGWKPVKAEGVNLCVTVSFDLQRAAPPYVAWPEPMPSRHP